MRRALLFATWAVLHLVSIFLILIWITPAVVVLLTWGFYRNWRPHNTPEWAMPWGLSDPYAKWVNRITESEGPK